MKHTQVMLCLALLLSGAGLLTGCRTYLHFRYGLSRPGEETPATIRAFLERNKYPVAGQYLFRDSAGYGRTVRDPLFRKHFFGHMIFDRQGVMLRRDTSKCQWWGYDRLRTMEQGGDYPRDSTLRLTDWLAAFRPLGNDSAAVADPDYTVVVTWAKFLGRYNYRLFNLAGAGNGDARAKIRLIWLNLDMLEEWHLRDGQKMDFR